MKNCGPVKSETVQVVMEPKRGAAGGADDRAVNPRMPAFFYRLSPAGQRTYLKSDAIERLPLAPAATTIALARNLMLALDDGTLSGVNAAAHSLITDLCRRFGVPPVRIEVRDVRPHNARGELHGIFYPSRAPLIILWMRTARRHDVVKPKTFLRTLLHELSHYLDYALLRLGDSFHTSGFFKRESFLVRTVYPSEELPSEAAPSEATAPAPTLAFGPRNLKHSGV
jgi:hypothetical protein